MLTIFTIPKAFQGHHNTTQRNAIRSWLQLKPKPEIILFGNDKGTEKTAREFGLLHIPQVKKNEFGTPLLNSAFNIAQKSAKNNILVELSSDIILMSDFIPTVKKISQPLFLMGGRRWDLEQKEEIDFSDSDWEKKLRQRIKREGKRHGFSAVDYFVFPRNLPHNLPSFAIGRTGWDNWLIYHISSLGIPTIDASQVITIIHQNHQDTGYYFKGEKGEQKKIETRKNLELRGGLAHSYTLRDVNWILTEAGFRESKLFRPLQHFYRFCGGILTFYPHLNFGKKILLFFPWLMIKTLKRGRDLLILRK